MAASDHLGIQFHPDTFAGYGMGEHRFGTSAKPDGKMARNSEATANDLGQRDAVERLHGQADLSTHYRAHIFGIGAEPYDKPFEGELEHFRPQTTFRWTN